jgi:hypothetical protein
VSDRRLDELDTATDRFERRTDAMEGRTDVFETRTHGIAAATPRIMITTDTTRRDTGAMNAGAETSASGAGGSLSAR